MANTINLTDIQNEVVVKYLMDNHGGKRLYIPKHTTDRSMFTRKDAIVLLREKGVDDNTICRLLKVYPCYVKKVTGHEHEHNAIQVGEAAN